MSKITRIEEQKKKKNRVNIYIDGKFSLGLYKDTLIKYHLYEGKDITQSEISQIKNHEILTEAKEKARNYLSYRIRSKKEVSDYLYRKQVNKDVVYKVISDFDNAGLLDDHEFALMWVKDRSMRNPKGNFVLRQELKNKGISDLDIELALRDIDERENALKAASKAHKKFQDKNKIMAYLVRRGFSHYLSKEVIEELLEESH
ncbi:MAG: hypothetical protein E3J23_02745 [Candidatus Stahlbacteria bacterium]|nr:MAG: hypothetical protein E3J23_02745 [Candidatus Stahlbacteria bacterium]